jgi:ribonuclease T2
MEDIMGTSGLAWHQWKKHGTCAGMSAAGYFDLSRQAYEAIKHPQVLRQLKDPVTLPAPLIEQAFLRDNPTLEADGVTVTCKQGAIQEVRICLSKDLTPVPCGRDVVKDCRLKDALFDPIR